MNAAIKNAILQHAEREYPKECCGVLVAIDGVPEYRPCRNMAEGNDHFVLHHEDYAAADAAGAIVAVVHSHPNGPAAATQADRVSCEASGLPWHIVTWPGKEWVYLEPSGYVAPLIGRVFAHGVVDCYSIVRDWYRGERGIDIPNFDRSDAWWYKGGNLYVENFQKAGFYRLPSGAALQPGDVPLMQVLANVPNHAGVYLGGGIILHHLYNRLSCREVYKGGYYEKHTVMVVRYGNTTENHSRR